MNMKQMGNRGWTLLEQMTVIALIGILAAITALSMRDYALTVRLQSATEMIGMDIRKARLTVFTRDEPYHIDFEPKSGTYLINDTDRIKLPMGISFGTAPGVTGKPSDPYMKPPMDGITFKAEGTENRAKFLPKSLVVPTGAVYLTNGRETMAITVSLNGHTNFWRSNGGSKWVEL
jgi:prepilin-type N-terminal cleavage/methylation domain-containing protein